MIAVDALAAAIPLWGVRFGLFYEHQLPRPWGDGDEARLLNDALEQVALADRVGVDYVWEVEHHFLEEYSHSSAPEVFLAAASQRTRRIRLGHGIVQLPPAVNHPARVAERVATLDLLSGGRVDFGGGEGATQMELGGFGIDRGEKRAQFEEGLELVTRMWTETPFRGFRGRYVDLPPRNVVPKPQQKPHPPLWMACSRRESIEYAASRGMGALAFAFVEPEHAKPWVDLYYETLASERCVPAGQAVNANVAVVLPFMCHPDEQTALERGIDGAHFFGYSLAYYLVFGTHSPGQTSLWERFESNRARHGFAREAAKATGGPLAVNVTDGSMSALRGAVGTPDQVADLVERYRQAGVDQVIFCAQAGRNRHEHICESIELLGERVAPRFAEQRERGERDKRERLAPHVERALARRPGAPVDGAGGGVYEVRTGGEPQPAPPRVAHRPRRPARSLTEHLYRGSRNLIAGGMEHMDDAQVQRWLGSRWALTLMFRNLARSYRPRGRAPEQSVCFVLDGPRGAERYHLVLEQKRARLVNGGAPEPTATVRAQLVDFLRAGTGQLDPGRAVLEGRLVVQGDSSAVARLMDGVGLQVF